ncbi:hypothetical protein SHK09_09265 [Polaribacter sp. PL03]|uniref:hypothetical protein n=1 Tax=Polaribacter sp. PL03 TaxID=3088353 RepID=UPI0029D1F67A|nr:hypothetical protein [Polaribacter sp. PL03]MDX6746978.1 hypothetical protein [Polaribacter sp. PL03]
MAINYKTRNNPEKTDDKQEVGFKIIFFALNFLLVPFSAIATYKGYRGFLDEYLAIVLATATGLLFFGLNYIIMERRKKGESHLKQSLGFLLPLLISFFGNFTYFYGNQMEGSLLNKDLTEYKTTFKKTYESAVSGLNNSTGLFDLETRLKGELKLLKFQMETPPTGYGKEAKKKWGEIALLFSDYNLKYNASSQSSMTKIHVKKYINFEKAAMSYFNSLKDSKENEVNTKLNELTSLYKPVNIVADSLLKSANEVQLKKGGVDVIKKIKSVNDDIGQKAKGFLTAFTYEEVSDYEAVNAKNIKSVLDSAFVRRDNNSATVFSIIISLIIDLATLGFVFLALSYNKERKYTSTGPRGL